MIQKEGNVWVLYSQDGARKLAENKSLYQLKQREEQLKKFEHLSKYLDSTKHNNK